eukprot:4341253-Amphidinium_carterae.2
MSPRFVQTRVARWAQRALRYGAPDALSFSGSRASDWGRERGGSHCSVRCVRGGQARRRHKNADAREARRCVLCKTQTLAERFEKRGKTRQRGVRIGAESEWQPKIA